MKILILVIAVITTSLTSFASDEVESAIERQNQMQGAFERGQQFHKNRILTTLYSRPSTVDQQSLSILQDIDAKALDLKNTLREVTLGGMEFLKTAKKFANRAWRGMTGAKNLPPTASSMGYLYFTGGPYPEVNWFLDNVTDPDGTIVRYEYDFGDGTTQVIPAGHMDSSKSISHIYLATGVYTASVKVYDNDGDFSTFSNSVNVTHSNQLPVPKFTLQNNQVPNFLKVDFTSAATDDVGIIRYTWRFGDGSADAVGSGLTTASRTYASPGLYNVSFVVRDSHRGQIGVTTQAYVGQHQPSGGMSPISLVYADRLAGVAPLSVQFDGSKSFDIGGSIVSYQWNFGDFANPRNVSYEAQPKYFYTQPGAYYGSLKVTDNGGRTSTRYFTVHVMPASGTVAPAEILAYPEGPRAYWFSSNYFNLHAPVPTNYQIWNFGDGSPQVRGSYPTHTYASDGVYTVTLHLYDIRGNVQQIQKNITVTSDQSAPTVYFQSSNTNTTINSNIDFITSNTNLVNPLTTASWDFGDGTRISGLHKDLLTVSHSYSNRGFYPITLVVTDEFGKTAAHTSYVNIQNSNWPVNAKIELSTVLGQIPLPMRFDARSSSSSAGSITNYNWAVYSPTGSQYNQNGVWTSVYPVGGEHYVDLYVEDQAGNTGYAHKIFNALDPALIPPNNNAPTANIQMSYFFGESSKSLNVNGYSSFDTDGDRIVSYDWIFDNSPASSDPGFNKVIVSDDETHHLTLRATDRWGAVGEKKVDFKYPTVEFHWSMEQPVRGLSIDFLGNDQTITLHDSQISSVEWSFGDGTPTETGDIVSHVFQNAGSYQVTMTVHDNLQRTYTRVRNITVVEPAAPQAKITIRDVAEIVNGGTAIPFVLTTKNPVEVNFDLDDSLTQTSWKSASWNFGDGSTGFGLRPNYVYRKPGTYTVTVTATNEQNITASSSAQVTVGTDAPCADVDGYDDCLHTVNTDGNIFQFSQAFWSLTHDKSSSLTWLPDGNDKELKVLLRAKDEESSANIDITSAVTRSGADIVISRDLLVPLGFDLTKVYQLLVTGFLSDDSEFSGGFPEVHFGIGQLNLSLSESDVNLIVSSAKGYRKFISLGNALTYTLNDLPAGSYTIKAEKDTRRDIFEADILSQTAENLYIDISTPALLKRSKDLDQAAIDKSLLEAKGAYDSGSIGWPNGVCGATYRHFADGIEGRRAGRGVSVIDFNSAPSENKIKDHPLFMSKGETVTLRCAVMASATNYSHYEGDLVDGVNRPPYCNMSASWPVIKAAAERQMKKKITLKWSIGDGVRSEIEGGLFSTSIEKILNDEDVRLSEITHKYGVMSRDDIFMAGPSFQVKFKIPHAVGIPKLNVSLISDHNSGATHYELFRVNCQAELAKTALPEIIGIGGVSSPYRHSAEFNGQQFIANKFFPVGVDSTLTNPAGAFKLPDIFKAKLEFRINSGNYSPQEIDRVKITVKNSFGSFGSHVYLIRPEDRGPVLADGKNFSAKLTINAADFEDIFPFFLFGNIINKYTLEFTPLGSGIDETNARGFEMFGITPFYNAKNLAAEGYVCLGGFYNSDRVSAYGTEHLIGRLNSVYDYNFPTRCNDMSLPWGGLFQTGPAKHRGRGHSRGSAADIRYFHYQQTTQDDYSRQYDERVVDIRAYLQLSTWAKMTSENQILREDFSDACKVATGNGSECSLQNLSHQAILSLCQSERRPEVATKCEGGSPGFYPKVLRFSEWASATYTALRAISTLFYSYRISDGSKVEVQVNNQPKNWQFMALAQQQWPDGTKIFQAGPPSYTGIAREQDPCFDWGIGLPSCGPVNIKNNFINDRNHFDHIHLE